MPAPRNALHAPAPHQASMQQNARLDRDMWLMCRSYNRLSCAQAGLCAAAATPPPPLADRAGAHLRATRRQEPGPRALPRPARHHALRHLRRARAPRGRARPGAARPHLPRLAPGALPGRARAVSTHSPGTELSGQATRGWRLGAAPGRARSTTVLRPGLGFTVWPTLGPIQAHPAPAPAPAPGCAALRRLLPAVVPRCCAPTAADGWSSWLACCGACRAVPGPFPACSGSEPAGISSTLLLRLRARRGCRSLEKGLGMLLGRQAQTLMLLGCPTHYPAPGKCSEYATRPRRAPGGCSDRLQSPFSLLGCARVQPGHPAWALRVPGVSVGFSWGLHAPARGVLHHHMSCVGGAHDAL